MADTLAGFGYAVWLPDVYYRTASGQPFYMATVFNDQAERERLFGMIGSVTPDMLAPTPRRSSTSSRRAPEVTRRDGSASPATAWVAARR